MSPRKMQNRLETVKDAFTQPLHAPFSDPSYGHRRFNASRFAEGLLIIALSALINWVAASGKLEQQVTNNRASIDAIWKAINKLRDDLYEPISKRQKNEDR